MEKTEPMLVPEWLRFTANLSGGGGSINHSDGSSAQSTRNRSCYLNRSSSFGSKHTSTTDGSSKHPYSSFSRSHCDKNRAKECFSVQDVCNRNYSCSGATTLNGGVDRGASRHSRSLVSKRPSEFLPQRVGISGISGKDVRAGKNGLGLIQKMEFEKDFPSLRSEEKQSVAGFGRVLSPCLASTMQTFPVGGSGFTATEKWTSALAEVPAVLTNNGTAQSSVQQSGDTFLNLSSGMSGSSCHNMAEALSQPTAKVLANPLTPDKNQKVEELAIRQSRQLIPLIPKTLVPSSADKSKQPKTASRINEMAVTSRGVHGQPNSSHLASQARCGNCRSSDATTASHAGKFLVLKAKDSSSANGDPSCKIMEGSLAMTTSSPATSISKSNHTVSAVENKVAALSLCPKATLTKRSYKSLSQSRREFLNLMRKKTSCGPNPFPSDPTNLYTSSEDAERVSCNGDGSTIPMKTNNVSSDSDMGGNNLSCDELMCPDEEEAAFLRSLGWEENGGEDGLTEEEINAFYEYMKARPSSTRASLHRSSAESKLPEAVSATVSST